MNSIERQLQLCLQKIQNSNKWRKKNFNAESYSNYKDMEIEEKDLGSGEETDETDEAPCALWGRVRVLVLYFYLNFNIYFLIQNLLKYISEILNNPNNRVLNILKSQIKGSWNEQRGQLLMFMW